MNRRAHGIGRLLACAGLLSTSAYLGWRITTLPGRSPTWLVVLALAVELVGFLGSILLTWALWRSPRAIPEDAFAEPRLVDVVVRVDQQPIHHVRATLLAMQSMSAGQHVIVDLGARLEIVALAAEFGTAYAAPDIDDHNGLKTCGAACASAVFLLLDAGDVPSADAISALLPLMDDDRVAVAIGQSVMADDDSAEHGPNGLHELRFDRLSLNPALGARGAAILSESGALIRRAAVQSVEVGDEQPLEAQAFWSMALMEQGWKIVAAAGSPLLVRQVIQSQDTVYEQRVMHARVARNMIFGPGGILRPNSLGVSQRLAIAASAVRPLSGLRRAGFIAAVVGSLLTGALPMRPNLAILAELWAPGWLLTSAGLGLASGWTLRPGDRTRWSLRNLGASWQGLRHPMAFEQRRAPIMTPHALQHGGALVASVVVLSAVMMMRGLSEKWTHALGRMPYQWLAGLIAVALWSLTMALDVLRMLGRRNQLRRAARVVASIPAEVDENPVAVFDITPLGAGFETNREVCAKQQLTFTTMITTARGCEDVTLPIIVRHVRNVSEERWRVGVEFGHAHPRALNPLIESCMVEPARQRLGVPPRVPTEEPDSTIEAVSRPVLDGRRLALRSISLMAVAGAIVSAQPGDGTIVAWLVSAVSILIAAGVLAGSARPRRAPWTVDQSTSSPSPDLAIR
ncbi:MAG TPA: glycosyltransferase family 2 protein [Ilumatobacteraceae bacterium]|nr:glycosyltransferase family 2 protein [Ilumatobacteraceae bacterium]